jgi:hypothetical protein
MRNFNIFVPKGCVFEVSDYWANCVIALYKRKNFYNTYFVKCLFRRTRDGANCRKKRIFLYMIESSSSVCSKF